MKNEKLKTQVIARSVSSRCHCERSEAIQTRLLRLRLAMTSTIFAIVYCLSTIVGLAQDKSNEPAAQAVVQPSSQATDDLKQLSQEYFSKNDYEGFYRRVEELLKTGSPGSELYYYKALARFREIESWKNVKDWEGVYDKAPVYKKEIIDSLQVAQGLLKEGPSADSVGIKYLKWQIAREDDPDRAVGLFNDFVNSVGDYAVSAGALADVKAMADELLRLEDKSYARRLYEIYAKKLSASDISLEQLQVEAEKFIAENNAYLAKSLFETYLVRLADDQERRVAAIVAIADRFADDGKTGGLDPAYAREMYKKAFAESGVSVFRPASLFREAFNVERMKIFDEAVSGYKTLLASAPDYPDKYKIFFRLGVLEAYGVKDQAQAEEYFMKLKNEDVSDAAALSSLYQLGLRAHFKNEPGKAQGFYHELLDSARAQGLDLEKNELVLLAHARLTEIEEKKELPYGLKLFFEGIYNTALSLNVDLTARPSKAAVGEPVRFIVTTSYSQTGCMTPVYSYEWSGEVGFAANIPNAPEFATQYASPGIKVVQVAVVGPQGLEGVGFEIVEVLGPQDKISQMPAKQESKLLDHTEKKDKAKLIEEALEKMSTR